VPTIVKLSNRCQSDKNHLVLTNISGAKKKTLASTNIGAGAKKNMNLPEPQEPWPQITNLSVILQKMLKKSPILT